MVADANRRGLAYTGPFDGGRLRPDGERLVWQEAFGVLDDSSRAPATPDTRFNVGSVSKVLAALAVMVLVDRQLLELDAPVVRYLPQFAMLSPGYRDITVRHLLNHASGLPGTHTHHLFAFAPQPGYAAALETALADVHLKHAPGAMAVYCNDGFTLVERIVLAVTGQAYPAFVQSAILNPLGMARSGYTLQPLPTGSFAHGYIGDVRQGQEFVMGYATGGLCTTPGDMMKLAALLMRGGELDGQVRSGAWPADAGIWQSWTSEPLAEVVRDINKFSNNVMARQLFLTLGGAEATARTVRETTATSTPSPCGPAQLVLDNGSGLSRTEGSTALCLGQWLQALWASPAMPDLVASLPLTGVDGTARRWQGAAGHARVKTGSLSGVAAVAGYVDGESGRRHVVVGLIQHPDAAQARPVLDALLSWVRQDQ